MHTTTIRCRGQLLGKGLARLSLQRLTIEQKETASSCSRSQLPKKKPSRVAQPSILASESPDSRSRPCVRWSQKWFARTLRLNTNSRASQGTVKKRGDGSAFSYRMRTSPAPVSAIGNARHSMEAAKRRTNPPANGSSPRAKFLMFRK